MAQAAVQIREIHIAFDCSMSLGHIIQVLIVIDSWDPIRTLVPAWA